MPQSPTSPPRLIDLIEARSAARPDDIAIEHVGRALTYGRLDALASALAVELRDAGVRPRDRVGVFLRRSPEMVVAIVAVLKLGAAYVPQDTGIAPAAQLAEVVRRADMSVVLTTTAHPTPLLHGVTVRAVDITRLADSPGTAQPTATRPSSPDLPCLVIFTSGTTGVPKGVVVTDGNLVNLLTRSPGDLGLGPGVRVSQLMNIAFDMAAWEILGALVNGATLVIRDRDFTETASSVDVVVATPGILARIDPDSCRGVSRVAVAGERCPVELADRWARQATFHNCCGPTEVTIVNTIGEHRPGAPLTIGRPVPGTTVHLLDDAGRPVRPGDLGEMWVGGAGVTAGYLDDDLTRERYRLDPFAADGSMMFATRDLARLTADGEYEHHGRTDSQVKVRGFRVELDAVARVLERAPGCRQAVVALLGDGTLGAVVTPADLDPALAAAVVAEHLPYYCVPSVVRPVAELPATARGKVDREAARRLLEPLRATA